MKKIFLTLGVVLFALASCTKENVTNDILGNSIVKATFEQDATTRLNVAADNALTWSTGDAFAMFGEGSSAKFTLESGAGTASATFAGTVPAVVNGAAFPYISEFDPSLTDGVLKMTLPATLEQSNEGVCNLPMWASASSVESIAFKHLAGVLRVKITDMPEGYNELVVAASAPISGVFTADVTVEKPVLASDSTEDSSKSVVVTFNEATDEANDYQLYLPLPVATYQTITLSISNGTETKELVKYNNKSVERAKIYTASLTYSSVTGNIITEVETEEALVEALTTGKSVVLTDDVNVSEPLSVDSSVVVDLNGKTLTFDAATRAASNYGIVNTGKLTISNGVIDDKVNHITIRNSGQLVLNNVELTTTYVAVSNIGVWADGMTVQKYKGTDAAVKFTMDGGSITSTTDDTSTNVYAVQSVDYSLTDIKNASIVGTQSAGGLHLNCAEAKLDNVVITRGTAGTAHQVHLIAGVLTYTDTVIDNYRYYYGDSKGKYGYAEVNGVYYGEVNTVVEEK